MLAEPTLVVQHWPPVLPFAAPRLLLLAVGTPATTRRDTARRMVREALGEILGAQLDCPPADLPLLFVAGQAPRVAAKHAPLGISIAHEPGLSLLAIHHDGAVGIDLLGLPARPPWSAEMPDLARDYLGPEIAGQIALLPAANRAAGFAAAWTRLEAGLKCLGVGLTEWTLALQQDLAACRYFRLQLPSGFVGAVALAGSAHDPLEAPADPCRTDADRRWPTPICTS